MKKLTRMQSTLFVLLLTIGVTVTTYAQIVMGQDTLVGNEWIDYDQSYYKMMLAEDGVYRVSYEELQAAGVPVQSLTGAELQVYYFGQEQAISVSTNGSLSAGDYIEFVGVKNRGELDKHLYREESDQLNPRYSLYSDTSAYFLTWEQGVTGKRLQEQTVDLTGNTLDPEPYYMHEDVVVFSSRVNKPSEINSVRFSQYMPGEGYCGDLKAINTFDHTISKKYDDGPAATLKVRMSGNNLLHKVDISFNDNLKLTGEFGLKETKEFDVDLDNSELNNGNNSIKVRSYLGSDDKNTIANSVIKYSREFDFDNKNEYQFTLSPSNQTRYVEIKNFDNSTNNISIIDITNDIRYIPIVEDDILKLIIPSTAVTITYKVVNDSAIKSVNSISVSPMTNYAEMNGIKFIIYTSKVFDKSSNDGINYLRAYADHRASENGGSLTPAIVFVEDLYNQYGYGVNRNPLAIKNHARWAEENWPDAKYNFVIGKSLEYAYARTEEQLNDDDPLFLKSIVPTFGIPGSDNTLFAKKNHSKPRLATGRISAASLREIQAYYEKVVAREDPQAYPSTIEGRLWNKRIVHLSGGNLEGEIASIKNRLASMGSIVNQSKFGGTITTFNKQSSDNIEIGFSSKIRNEVKTGAGLLTFFGHSSPGSLDFALEKAVQYDNEGKLPVFFSMGCYSGNIHTQGKSISEDFVLESKVGSIIYLASSGSAYLGAQGDLGVGFYQAVGSDEFFTASIGEIMQHLLEPNNTNDTNVSLRTLNEQFTLHGDPAIKLNTFVGPDYTVDYTSINTEPSVITPESDEFKVEFEIANLGENINDSIEIRTIQTLPDGSVYDTTYSKVKAPGYLIKDTLTLRSPGLEGVGKNCISIELNYNGSIVESPSPDAYSNNLLRSIDGEDTYCFYVLDNSANPIFPEKFAIVNKTQPKLIASTSNILAEDRKYLMELDTTALFNSSIKETKEINDGGGSLTWQPETEFIPGKVYYWRVSPDSIDVNIGYQWRESSFIYLPNSSEGWNQSHYFQFLENNLDGIDYEDRKLDFINEAISISGTLHIPQYDAAGSEVLWPRWFQDDHPLGKMRTWDYISASIPDGIAIAYRDNDENEFIENQSLGGRVGLHGSTYYGTTQRLYFYPTNSAESRSALITMLTEVIPDGYHVFLYTVTNSITSDLDIDEWALDSLGNEGKNIFNVLEEQGATLVRSLEQKGTVPYGMIYTKNELFRDEKIGEDRFSVVSVNSEFERNYTEGDFNTTDIGPALSWDKMIWKVEDQTSSDTYMVYVKGLKTNGEMDTLFTIMAESEIDLSSIDAATYPYLRLDMFTKDEVDRTPVNIDYWRVFYDSPPEAVLTKDDSFVFNSDTLQQGQLMEFSIQAENISSSDMDSLLVKYTITNSNNESIVNYERKAPLKSNESQQLNFSYDTKSLQGDNQFNFEINPELDQPEKFVFNNFGVKDFHVLTDNKEPVLDVSFDGVHIINGDIVAANPFILIDVRDENKYLLLDDPESILVALIDPQGNRTEYNISSQELSFEPATDFNKNQAKISLEPTLLLDGDYTLMVQAEDASGNLSGDNAYEVTFRVILKESVSNVLNYPNPFSSQTQFIFTLTGSEVPDDISITILTVSGKVVKEISREELGPLRIGINRTEYKWNGTDDYGVKLANGVYLYKVNLPADMERYENQAADKFFTKGFGKLVIMR